MLKLILSSLILPFALLCSSVHGSVILERDRLFFEAGARSAGLRITGDAKATYLVQAWVSKESGEEAPMFSVLPQLSVIKPRSVQLIKALYQGEGLPEDRESLLWLNIQEIPTAVDNQNDNANTLSASLVQSIPLIYRPTALANMSSENAALTIKASILEDTPKKLVLKLNNTSPMYVSIVSVFTSAKDLQKGGIDAVSPGAGFFAPFDEKTFTIDKSADIGIDKPTDRRVWMVVRNDSGFDVAYYAYIKDGKIGAFEILQNTTQGNPKTGDAPRLINGPSSTSKPSPVNSNPIPQSGAQIGMLF